MDNLEEVITNAVEESLPDETPIEATPEPAPEAPEPPQEASPETPAPETPAEETIATEAKPEDAKPTDGFEAIPALNALGRENRIPHSRVKGMIEKAVAKKEKELTSSLNPKLQDYEAKIKTYETQLAKVNEFEQIMVNKPDQFLDMLAGLPVYQPFFKAIEDAFSKLQAQPNPTQPQVEPTDDMPEPDEELSDGSMVYSKKGLRALLDWQAAQVTAKVTKQVEERYKPIESEYQATQRINSLVPKVKAQIAEAQTWPLFTENEAEIVEALKNDGRLSLEGAYRRVVFPKIEAAHKNKLESISADRNKIREEILKELKQAPKSTAAPSSQSKAVDETTGPKSLEDIITEATKSLKR